MKRRSAIGIALLTSVMSAGCAALWESAKYCGETPQNAVMAFISGVPELSIQVTADGDDKRGRMRMQAIIDHPEVRRGNKVTSAYYIADMTPMATLEVWTLQVVTVHREDQVFLVKEERQEEQLYSKLFRVKFAPRGNCILEISPSTGWSRIR